MAFGIYIIKIGWFVCGQLCDWSVRSVGLAANGRARAYVRAGPARMRGQGTRAARASQSFKPKTSIASFRLVIYILKGTIMDNETDEKVEYKCIK